MHPKQGHKPKREIQDIRASEVAELRSENQHLRRENARLRRELSKAPVPTDEEPNTLAEAEPPKEAPKCPKCNGKDLVVLDMNNKSFVCCKTCKWRKAQ